MTQHSLEISHQQAVFAGLEVRSEVPAEGHITLLEVSVAGTSFKDCESQYLLLLLCTQAVYRTLIFLIVESK